MNLSTNYLGLQLKNPIIGVASLLSRNLDVVKNLEDAGAGGIVMYSLFEEKIRSEQEVVDEYFIRSLEGFAEASDFFPKQLQLTDLSGEEYLRYLEQAKSAVDIPVIASLAGVSKSGWVRYAKDVVAAGADAIELNEFYVPTDLNMTAQEVEQRYLEDLTAVKEAVSVPVSIKVAPFF